MKELVTTEQVEKALRVVAIAAPLVGLVIGATIGLLRRRAAGGAVLGLVIGMTGTVIFGLWRMYHLFGKHLGYTRTSNLSIQLAIFAGLGVVAGIVVQRMIDASHRRDNKQDPSRKTGGTAKCQ